METLQKLKQQDFSVIFISHKLNEVMAICDRISVLRDGKMIGTVNKSDVTQKDLACMMSVVKHLVSKKNRMKRVRNLLYCVLKTLRQR
jgi:ABC-type uncharacterized transport system ATPase subunit